MEKHKSMPPLEIPNLPDNPLADKRLSIPLLYKNFSQLCDAGWQSMPISNQKIDGIRVPIYGFDSGQENQPIDYIVIANIHGDEPAGSNALADYIDKLIAMGKNKRAILLPLCNPWGYYHNEYYNPEKKSVTDSEYFLQRTKNLPCQEAQDIISFLIQLGGQITNQALVLDLHEDADYKEKEKEDTHLFVHIKNISEDDYTFVENHPIIGKILAIMREKTQLIEQGITHPDPITKVSKEIRNGVAINHPDGSVDELLADYDAAVVVPELLLKAIDNPPLEERVEIYKQLLDVFFGLIAEKI